MKNIKIYSLFLLAFITFNSYSQVEGINLNNPRYSVVSGNVEGASLTNNVTFDVAVNQSLNPLIEEVFNEKLYLKLDLGEDLVLNLNDDEEFELDIDLTYQFIGGTNSSTNQKTISISRLTPEKLEIIDVTNQLSNNTSLRISVLAKTTSPSPLSSTYLTNLIAQKLRLKATFVREHKVDVRLASNNNFAPNIFLTQLPDQLNKRVHFSWNTANHAYPNYEIQVLRIFNEAPYNINPGIANDVKIDWNKALKIETQSYKTEIDLIVAEGKGWYTWRVRPIGSYYEGGIGNSDNYGAWSNSYAQGDEIDFGAGGTSANAFYLIDNDDQKNWNYTRVFTEGDETGEQGVRTSEGMTYADGLLRTRQSQQYNSSGDNPTTIVSQTISDYSGRPALTTLPVPVSGDLTGYKETFVQSSTGTTTVYTAKDYDTDSKIQNPDRIKDVGTDFEYYNGERTDGVADANEYSFSRTVFKTDGTGRATESSGVGEKHALGDRAAGRGRTTKVLYSSPSDAELIRIFGDEAPLAESVIKTITSDPNDVISLAYTSKEGKTIATALISNETDNLKKLEGINSDHIFTVENITDQNVLSFNKFVSSKRIAIVNDGTEVTLGYKLTGANTPVCGGDNCNYVVRFYLTDLTNGKKYKSNEHNLPTAGNNIDFNEANNSLVLTEISGQASPSILVQSTDGKFILGIGEYLVTKEVYSLTNANSIAAAAMIRADNIEAILLDITDRMDAVNNQDDLDDFIAYLENTAPTAYSFPSGFTVVYNSSTKALDITDNGPSEGGGSCQDCATSSITIPTPEICEVCKGVDLVDEIGTSLSPIETIRESANVKILYNSTAWNNINAVVDNYFIKYLEDKLNDTYATIPGISLTETQIQDKLRNLAPGFTKESLAYMITNMLASRYYVGNTTIHNNLRYRAAENEAGVLERVDANGKLEFENSGEFVTAIESNDLADEYNYKNCEELYLCWTQAVDMINSFEFEDGINLMDAYNEENAGGESSDDHANSEDAQEGSGNGSSILNWFVNRKMRNSDGNELSKGAQESLVSLPNLFLNCTGYSYADIIDDEHVNSLPIDYNQTTPFGTETVNNNDVLSGAISALGGNTPPRMMVFDLNDDLDIIGATPEQVTECGDNPVSYDQLNYPYVLKPEWMFKYFVYNAYDNTGVSDADDYILTQRPIEISTNYNKLSGCAPTTPLCFEVNQYDHKDWSSGQRLNFYQQIRGGKKTVLECVYSDEVNNTPTPLELTEENLLDLVREELSDALQACESNRGEIRNGLITALEGACYEVVEDCDASPTQVNELGLNLMVDKVVEKCIAKVHTVTVKIFANTNNDFAMTTANYSDSQYGTAIYGPDHTAAPNTTPKFPYHDIITCCYYDASGTTQTAAKRTITLFPACDQAILDQVNNWSFIPYISPIAGCTKNTPLPNWKNNPDFNCIGGDCGTQECTPTSGDSDDSIYTTETPIDASINP